MAKLTRLQFGGIAAIVIAAVAVVTLASAARNGRATSRDSNPTDVLLEIVSETPVSLGVLPPMSMAERTVVFRNVSSRTVRLELFGLSCSCVDTAFTKTVLHPGEESAFHMHTLVTDDRESHYHRAAILAEAGSQVQNIGVAMAFQTVSPYVVEPRRIVIFQSTGSASSTMFYLRPTADDDIQVHEVVSTLGEGLTAEWKATPAGPGSGVAIRLAAHFDHPGVYFGWIRVSTDSRIKPEFALPIVVRVDSTPPTIVVIDVPPTVETAEVVHDLGSGDDMPGCTFEITPALPRGISAVVEDTAHGPAVRFSATAANLPEASGVTDVLVISDDGVLVDRLRLVWIGALHGNSN